MRSWRTILGGALALLVVAGLLLDAESIAITSSTFTKSADGWYGVRQALDQAGVERRILRRPWDEFGNEAPQSAAGVPGEAEPSAPRPEESVWLVAFPWQRRLGDLEAAAAARFLRDGGVLVVGHSSSRPAANKASEAEVLGLLGMTTWVELRDDPPLAPGDWWRYQRRLDQAQREPADRPDLELAALRAVPKPPPEARAHYRLKRPDGEGDGVPLVFSLSRDRGEVILAPAALWSNAELSQGDNLASLAEIIQGLEHRTWWIDEYHHGWGLPVAADGAASGSWLGLLLHLLVIYALGVWALARRFGPTWQDPEVRVGSTALFLNNLGGFHHRLGHHRQAAERLWRRTRDLHPNLTHVTDPTSSNLPTEEQAREVTDGNSLVDFADRVTRFRRSLRS